MTEELDNSPPLSPARKTRIQRIIGTILYYVRAVDSSILPCLGTLGTAQSKPIENTGLIIYHLLSYLHTHPNTTMRYKASGMVMYIHNDALYLSEDKARLRAGRYFYLSKPFRNPPIFVSYLQPPNGAIHVISTVLKNVMASVSKAELRALFLNT